MYLQKVDHLLNAAILWFCFAPTKLCALVVPRPLLLIVHKASLCQLALTHPIGDHQTLIVRVLVFRKARRVQANLTKTTDETLQK